MSEDEPSAPGYREPDSGWLRDGGARPAQPSPFPTSPRAGRPTARLSQGRISVPTTRRRVVSRDPADGASFDVAPHFSPDGMLLGGVAVHDDGREEQLSADQVEALFTPEEIEEARREAEEFLRTAAGFGLSDPVDEAGVSPRRVPPSGGWGFDTRRDATTTGSPDLGGYARRVGGKVARRAFDVVGPLALLGMGWLWGRARVAGAKAAPYTPGYHGQDTSGRTKRRDLMAYVTVGAVVLLVISMCSLGTLIWQWHGLLPPGLGRTTGNACCDSLTPGNAPSDTPDPGASTATSCTSCNGSGGGGKGTPAPTLAPGQPTYTPAQPTYTPAPTSPADQHAPSATVSFTRTTANATAPATLSTCDGCTDSAGSGTTRGQKASGGPLTQAGGSWGNVYHAGSAATSSVIEVEYSCDSANNFCSAAGGQHLVDQSGAGNDCHTLATVSATPGTISLVQCQLYKTGPISAGQTNYFGEAAPCGNICAAEWVKSQYTDVLGANGSGAYYTVPSSCAGDGGAAARANVGSALDSALGAGLGADAIGIQVAIGNGGYCANPANCGGWSPGQDVGGASTYTICASGSGWKLTFSPSGAQTAQKARVAPPAGYVVGGAIQVCGVVSVQSTDPANARAVLACPAQASAAYDWTQAKQDTLRSQLAGKTVDGANGACAATPGVAAGSYTVTLPGGGYTLLPADPAKITLTIN